MTIIYLLCSILKKDLTMKLYNEYIKVLKKLDKIEKAYFTTFNLDISFVEKYLIPPLLKDDIADNKLSLEDLNISLMKNSKPDIKFFYDANMLTSFDKKTLVETYPILIKNGVFHPKVIYLKGSNASYLFVGSGNLTVSGWGRNIEAFEIVEILNNGHLEKQVLNFFDEIFELADIDTEKTNKTLRKILPHKYNFVYSFYKNSQSNSPLLEALHLDKSLQLFSPYFSDDLDQLFQKEEFDTLNEINIIPDLIENQKIRLKKLPTIMKEKINFYRFEENDYFENNQDSTNHSKIWISDTHYAIGSHNCTEQALYGKNFEASLVQRYANKEDFSLNSFAIVDNLDTSGKDESIEEEIDDGDKFTSLYKLTANYKNYTLKPEDISKNIEINKIYIKLPGLKEKMLTHLELYDLEYSKRVQVFRALSKNKIFEIYSDSSLIYRGIIFEKNATPTTRLVDCAETLDDIFVST